MNKLNAIISISSLLVGVFIGTHADTHTQHNDKTSNGEFNTPQVQFYDDMILNANTIEIYDTSELTPEIMKNRNGKIVVEKIIGVVTTQQLDGEILNCDYDEGGYTNKDGGNYISYKRAEKAKQGDTILTYFIYNPFTNEQDDVLTRLDFIIDCNSI